MDFTIQKVCLSIFSPTNGMLHGKVPQHSSASALQHDTLNSFLAYIFLVLYLPISTHLLSSNLGHESALFLPEDLFTTPMLTTFFLSPKSRVFSLQENMLLHAAFYCFLIFIHYTHTSLSLISSTYLQENYVHLFMSMGCY